MSYRKINISYQMVDNQLLWYHQPHNNSLLFLMLNIIDDSFEPVWNHIVLTKINYS
jgi:hypothetical protein